LLFDRFIADRQVAFLWTALALNDAKRQPDSMPGTATSKAIAQQVQLKICMDILPAAGNVLPTAGVYC
jgi:tryptophanase